MEKEGIQVALENNEPDRRGASERRGAVPATASKTRAAGARRRFWGRDTVVAFLDRHLPPVPWNAGPRERPAPRAASTPKRPVRHGKLEAFIGLIVFVLVLPYVQDAMEPADAAAPVADTTSTIQGASGVDDGYTRVVGFTGNGEVQLEDGRRIGLLGVLVPTRDQNSLNSQILIARNQEATSLLPLFAEEVAHVVQQLTHAHRVEVGFDPALHAGRLLV